VRDARVAADAPNDLVVSAAARLRRQIGIGDQRPRHAHGVGRPLCDEAIRDDGVHHARGQDQRLSGSGRPGVLGDDGFGDRSRRHDPGRAQICRRIAEGERDVVDLCGVRSLQDRGHMLRVGGHAEAETQSWRCLPDGADDREQEPWAGAPDVRAVVELRVEELLD
jgi:hypothetical protein